MVANRIFRPLGPDVDRVFDSAADWVGDGRGGLSNRLWLARAIDRKAIDDILRRGLATGANPLVVAKELHAHLTPEGLSTLTRTPRSGVGNYAARRLARTEASHAFNEGVVQAAAANPFVEGVKWNLSGAHDDADECDEHARGHSADMGPGEYRIDEFPTIPSHPHCRCFATQVTIDDVDAVVKELLRDVASTHVEAMGTPTVATPSPAQPTPLVPRFRRTDEAVTWIQDRLANEVILGKQNVAALQSIAEGLEEALTPYGARVDRLDLAPTLKNRRNAAYRRMAGAEDRVGDIAIAQSYSATPGAARSATKKARETFEIRRSHEIATMEHAIADPTQQHMLARNIERLEQVRATERWTVAMDTADPLKTTVIHESGHAVYYQRNLVKAWESGLKDVSRIDQYRVSEYGASDAAELFAEAFAARRTGTSLPASIANLLDEVLRAAE